MSIGLKINSAVYDLDCLIRNLSAIRRRLPPGVDVFAALKGNAYGHGVMPVAQALERNGVTAFMTGSFEEACAMKAAGICARIILFANVPPNRAGQVVAAGLIPTIVDLPGARTAGVASSSSAQVFVKLDLGLGRLGVPEEEAEDFLDALCQMPKIEIAGLYTHLPFSDQAGLAWARERYAAFDRVLRRLEKKQLLPPITQASASSSIAAGLKDRANTVCVGHLLFGLSPFSDPSTGNVEEFDSVLCELQTCLVQVSKKRQGRDAAIASMYGLRQDKRIGVAPIGTAHGLKQPMTEKTPLAIVRGKRIPILAVCLEHLILDLDLVDDADAGDKVLLLGRDGETCITLDELARWCGLSNLEMTMAICGRIHAVYRGSY